MTMFGKRSATDGPPPSAATAPARAAPVSRPASAPTGASAAPRQSPPPSAADAQRAAAAPAPDPTPQADFRSEEFYRVKSTIFTALIETIDLAQLAQLDPESAREEIRDIVAEIIAIKNVVMSISEQEILLEDICN